MHKRVLASTLLICFITLPAQAQLKQTFDNVFNEMLREGFVLSPGAHADHFLPAAEEANNALTPALNSLIAGNIASFPLSSSVAGITFDFSTGQPVPIQGNLGPIFAENAETLGKGQLVVGFSATHLSLDSFRGVPLENMRFTFLHEDVGNPGLGDNPNENDVVDITLGLDASANIFALFARYGITPNLDVSLAIPFVDVHLQGTAHAVVQSFTLALGGANHFFDGTASMPTLQKDAPYEANASGIGNIALQLKYHLPLEGTYSAGLLLDVRVPTGDEDNFLGTGSASARGLLLVSRKVGDFAPHINIGYDYRGADLDSDELELIVGFDQKLIDGLNFALDFLGEFDVNKNEAIKLLPGTVSIVEQVPNTSVFAEKFYTRSNVPDQDHDHTLNAAIGFRVAPSENFQVLGNLLVPLQDDGLRSNVAPTIGLVLSF